MWFNLTKFKKHLFKLIYIFGRKIYLIVYVIESVFKIFSIWTNINKIWKIEIDVCVMFKIKYGLNKMHSFILVGARDLRPLWSPPVSLNLVHVLVFFLKLLTFLFFIFMYLLLLLLLLLFCIIKINYFFFTYIYLFIWMQVWSLEKEDTPHFFSSRVFLIFYYLFGFFIFGIFFLLKLFYCISLSLFHLFPFLFYSFIVFTFFLVYVCFMFLFFLFLFCLSSFFSIYMYLCIYFLFSFFFFKKILVF